MNHYTRVDKNIAIGFLDSVIVNCYHFYEKDAIGGKMEGYVFQSTDSNEDEFKYFFLCMDTPATTYHIEFRYGSDLNDLTAYANDPQSPYKNAKLP